MTDTHTTRTGHPQRCEPDPRSERSRVAILQATVALMLDRGMASVSIEAIAAKSGVAKTTIYRHWTNREDLLLSAWSYINPPDAPIEQGTFLQQASDAASSFAERIGSGPLSALFSDLLAAAARDPAIDALYDQILNGRRRIVTEKIQRAAEAGELRHPCDAELIAHLVLGAITFEVLVLRRPMDIARGKSICAAVFAAFGGDPTDQRQPASVPSDLQQASIKKRVNK